MSNDDQPTTHDKQRAALAAALSAVSMVKPRKPAYRSPVQVANLLRGDTTRFWRRCGREGCRGAAVTGANRCYHHGGAIILKRDGRLKPAAMAMATVRKMQHSGQLPPDLLAHPLFIAVSSRSGRKFGPLAARLTLAYLDMLDTGDISGWTEATRTVRAALEQAWYPDTSNGRERY